MAQPASDHEFAQALKAIEEENIRVEEKVEMLLHIANGLQVKPKSPQQLQNAVTLLDRAYALCPDSETLLAARIQARRGAALQIIPSSTGEYLQKARDAFEEALPMLYRLGANEETAEAEMNLGLAIQSLASINAGLITDAISAYQRSLKTFTQEKYPKEYAILHNNLATAYLSIPMTDEKAKMREALAVQSFEEALKVVTLIDQPGEYAMLQNNLGNALQYASSSHVIENNLRALDAYDEALKVRTVKDTPLEYANTICNKANCLRNLPDDTENPESEPGNIKHLQIARDLYLQAQRIFNQFGDSSKAVVIEGMLTEVNQDLLASNLPQKENDFGASRI